tara:strand:+ start:229 stop:690 length:462 start_codon:yes stop_codon:yes gene_type:complete
VYILGKGLTISAFVLSLLFFIPFAPLIGLILGIIALVKSKNDPNASKGLAIAAVVLGAFLGFINLIIFFGLILGFTKSMLSSPESLNTLQEQLDTVLEQMCCDECIQDVSYEDATLSRDKCLDIVTSPECKSYYSENAVREILEPIDCYAGSK